MLFKRLMISLGVAGSLFAMVGQQAQAHHHHHHDDDANRYREEYRDDVIRDDIQRRNDAIRDHIERERRDDILRNRINEREDAIRAHINDRANIIHDRIQEDRERAARFSDMRREQIERARETRENMRRDVHDLTHPFSLR